MKPWFQEDMPVTFDFQAVLDAAVDDLRTYAESLGDGTRLVLNDLQTPVATRFVAFPLRHVHDQECGRA